jgi:hypothetical protein
MARSAKTPFVLVLSLVVVFAVLAYVAYSTYEGFRTVDCLGVTCPEGQFCQSNQCHPIYPPTTA